MALSKLENIEKFNQAKAGSLEAINYFVNYFIQKIEMQLQNLNFTQDEKLKKIDQCREVVITNLHNYYDVNSFIDQTLQDLKKIVYLNKLPVFYSSEEIVRSQRDFISSKLATFNLDLITNISVKDRELARLYYIKNKSIEELVEMFKCSKTVLYFKLRKIADAILKAKSSNYVQNEETFIYRR